MTAPGHTPTRVWADTGDRAFAVHTSTPIAAFRCPVCRGAVLTRPMRRATCAGCHDWVCHVCGAHGGVHTSAGAGALEISEACG